jgi:methylmalonyl-CoA/ethylmalonyl-CoA epimerase
MKQNQGNIKPLEITQVGIVVRNRENAMQRIRSLLGIDTFRLLDLDQPEAIVHGKKTPCGAKLAFARVGPVEIELIEPGEDASIWSEFLRAKGEGVQHLGIFVSDLNKELARFKETGIGELQSGGTENVRFVYLDTEGTIGVIIELLEIK